MDSTGRFEGRAEDYARSRPDYPREAIDAILAGLGDPLSLVAADVGAGTGIASRALAERGALVLAFEPNTDMRRRGRSAGTPRVIWRNATAEDTGLGPDSVDLVVAAQAFHWFARDRALDEFVRILRPGGRVAVMWNDRDEEDDLTSGYSRLVSSWTATRPDAGFAAIRPFEDRADLEEVRHLRFPHRQDLDEDGFLGRARSASYFPDVEPDRSVVLDALSDLHCRHADGDGRVVLRYETELWLAELA